MGLHIGLVAARAPFAQLRDTFLRLSPAFDLVESADFTDGEALLDWKESREHIVPATEWSKANPGRDVYAFWQDSKWGVLMDSSYVLPSEEDRLAELSRYLGLVVSLVIESASGCALFYCFKEGRERRMINYTDGDLATRGDPLPHEAAIDIKNFNEDQAEALWTAIGLSSLETTLTLKPLHAMCVVDRTDYSKFL